MKNWQPIETAPRDGTRILLFRPTAYCSLHVVAGVWNPNQNCDEPRPYWSHDAEQKFGTMEARKFQPTHWQPLPKAPAQRSVPMTTSQRLQALLIAEGAPLRLVRS